MALFRKFFYRKPPDGLLEISEGVYVFDCCFTTDVIEDQNYKSYIDGIVGQLQGHLPDASFMVFNFREGDNQSQINDLLSEYAMTVIDYPRQYEGCPLLTIEMINYCLRSGDRWLLLGQRNVLLMHCERGGWPILAFMLAALLIYRNIYNGEQKTLDMIYRQAPRELLQLMCPLNPLPSQLRYLQYISRRNLSSEWPPPDRALMLDCIILRLIPTMDGEGGCRPVIRIYGLDPSLDDNRTTKLLFSTPIKSRIVRHYKQKENELVKIDIHCHVQGDIVLECISIDDDLQREKMMFRVMFSTAFIRSNILILNRDEIDTLWDSKDHFPKDFRTEVLFSYMDSENFEPAVDMPDIEEKEGLPVEAFDRVHEIFNSVDWTDSKSDVALNVLQRLSSSPALKEKLEMVSRRRSKSDSFEGGPSPRLPKEEAISHLLIDTLKNSPLKESPLKVMDKQSDVYSETTTSSTQTPPVKSPDVVPTVHSQSPSMIPRPPMLVVPRPPPPSFGFTTAPSSPTSTPPPFPPSSVRPPPPPTTSTSRMAMRTPAQSKKANLKPYHWLKLTRVVQGSLWAATQKSDEASKAPDFDISELENLFAASVPNSDNGGPGGKSSRRATPKVGKVRLVELRRASNCEIMLSKVKVPIPELMDAVLALDDSALDIGQVENLIKLCPTKEDMDLLKGYKGDKENLGKCELLFLELMKVPRVESKLRVFAFKMQFNSQLSELRNNLKTVNSISEEITTSAKLERVMQTILSLGNALNQGTARGAAVGFRLDSLLKLTDTRARNNKMTLMHYLCKVLAEKLPELLDFPKDLSSLEGSTKIQLKFLAEEMQAISKGIEKVVQELTASGNDGPVLEAFCKILKQFLAYAEGEVRNLASLYSVVGRNADALAMYFGDDPAKYPFEQVVSTLLNFVRMFSRAHEENCKQLKFDKKKADKES